MMALNNQKESCLIDLVQKARVEILTDFTNGGGALSILEEDVAHVTNTLRKLYEQTANKIADFYETGSAQGVVQGASVFDENLLSGRENYANWSNNLVFAFSEFDPRKFSANSSYDYLAVEADLALKDIGLLAEESDGSFASRSRAYQSKAFFTSEFLSEIESLEERVKEFATVSAGGDVIAGGLHSSEAWAGLREAMKERLRMLEREGYISRDDISEEHERAAETRTDNENLLLSLLSEAQIATQRVDATGRIQQKVFKDGLVILEAVCLTYECQNTIENPELVSKTVRSLNADGTITSETTQLQRRNNLLSSITVITQTNGIGEVLNVTQRLNWQVLETMKVLDTVSGEMIDVLNWIQDGKQNFAFDIGSHSYDQSTEMGRILFQALKKGKAGNGIVVNGDIVKVFDGALKINGGIAYELDLLHGVAIIAQGTEVSGTVTRKILSTGGVTVTTYGLNDKKELVKNGGFTQLGGSNERTTWKYVDGQRKISQILKVDEKGKVLEVLQDNNDTGTVLDFLIVDYVRFAYYGFKSILFTGSSASGGQEYHAKKLRDRVYLINNPTTNTALSLGYHVLEQLVVMAATAGIGNALGAMATASRGAALWASVLRGGFLAAGLVGAWINFGTMLGDFLVKMEWISEGGFAYTALGFGKETATKMFGEKGGSVLGHLLFLIGGGVWGKATKAEGVATAAAGRTAAHSIGYSRVVARALESGARVLTIAAHGLTAFGRTARYVGYAFQAAGYGTAFLALAVHAGLIDSVNILGFKFSAADLIVWANIFSLIGGGTGGLTVLYFSFVGMGAIGAAISSVIGGDFLGLSNDGWLDVAKFAGKFFLIFGVMTLGMAGVKNLLTSMSQVVTNQAFGRNGALRIGNFLGERLGSGMDAVLESAISQLGFGIKLSIGSHILFDSIDLFAAMFTDTPFNSRQRIEAIATRMSAKGKSGTGAARLANKLFGGVLNTIREMARGDAFMHGFNNTFGKESEMIGLPSYIFFPLFKNIPGLIQGPGRNVIFGRLHSMLNLVQFETAGRGFFGRMAIEFINGIYDEAFAEQVIELFADEIMRMKDDEVIDFFGLKVTVGTLKNALAESGSSNVEYGGGVTSVNDLFENRSYLNDVIMGAIPSLQALEGSIRKGEFEIENLQGVIAQIGAEDDYQIQQAALDVMYETLGQLDDVKSGATNIGAMIGSDSEVQSNLRTLIDTIAMKAIVAGNSSATSRAVTDHSRFNADIFKLTARMGRLGAFLSAAWEEVAFRGAAVAVVAAVSLFTGVGIGLAAGVVVAQAIGFAAAHGNRSKGDMVKLLGLGLVTGGLSVGALMLGGIPLALGAIGASILIHAGINLQSIAGPTASTVPTIKLSGADLKAARSAKEVADILKSLPQGAVLDLDVSDMNFSNASEMNELLQILGSGVGSNSGIQIKISGLSSKSATEIQELTAMLSAVQGMNKLIIDVSGLDAGQISKLTSALSVVSGIPSIQLTGLNTADINALTSMLATLTNIEVIDLDLSGLRDANKINQLQGMLSSIPNLKNLKISGLANSDVTAITEMLNQLKVNGDLDSLEVLDIDLSGLNAAKAQEVVGLLSDLSGLPNFDKINLKGLNSIEMSALGDVLDAAATAGVGVSLDMTGVDSSHVSAITALLDSLSSTTKAGLTDLKITGMSTFGEITVDVSSLSSSAMTKLGKTINAAKAVDAMAKTGALLDGGLLAILSKMSKQLSNRTITSEADMNTLLSDLAFEMNSPSFQDAIVANLDAIAANPTEDIVGMLNLMQALTLVRDQFNGIGVPSTIDFSAIESAMSAAWTSLNSYLGKVGSPRLLDGQLALIQNLIQSISVAQQLGLDNIMGVSLTSQIGQLNDIMKNLMSDATVLNHLQNNPDLMATFLATLRMQTQSSVQNGVPIDTSTFGAALSALIDGAAGMSVDQFDNQAAYFAVIQNLVGAVNNLGQLGVTVTPGTQDAIKNLINNAISELNTPNLNLSEIQAMAALQSILAAIANASSSNIGVDLNDINIAGLVSGLTLNFNLGAATNAKQIADQMRALSMLANLAVLSGLSAASILDIVNAFDSNLDTVLSNLESSGNDLAEVREILAIAMQMKTLAAGQGVNYELSATQINKIRDILNIQIGNMSTATAADINDMIEVINMLETLSGGTVDLGTLGINFDQIAVVVQGQIVATNGVADMEERIAALTELQKTIQSFLNLTTTVSDNGGSVSSTNVQNMLRDMLLALQNAGANTTTAEQTNVLMTLFAKIMNAISGALASVTTFGAHQSDIEDAAEVMADQMKTMLAELESQSEVKGGILFNIILFATQLLEFLTPGSPATVSMQALMTELLSGLYPNLEEMSETLRDKLDALISDMNASGMSVEDRRAIFAILVALKDNIENENLSEEEILARLEAMLNFEFLNQLLLKKGELEDHNFNALLANLAKINNLDQFVNLLSGEQAVNTGLTDFILWSMSRVNGEVAQIHLSRSGAEVRVQLIDSRGNLLGSFTTDSAALNDFLAYISNQEGKNGISINITDTQAGKVDADTLNSNMEDVAQRLEDGEFDISQPDHEPGTRTFDREGEGVSGQPNGPPVPTDDGPTIDLRRYATNVVTYARRTGRRIVARIIQVAKGPAGQTEAPVATPAETPAEDVAETPAEAPAAKPADIASPPKSLAKTIADALYVLANAAVISVALAVAVVAVVSIIAIAAPALAPIVAVPVATVVAKAAVISAAAFATQAVIKSVQEIAKGNYFKALLAPALIIGGIFGAEAIIENLGYIVEGGAERFSLVTDKIALIAALVSLAAISVPILALPAFIIWGVVAAVNLYNVASPATQAKVQKVWSVAKKIASVFKIATLAEEVQPAATPLVISPVTKLVQTGLGFAVAPVFVPVTFAASLTNTRLAPTPFNIVAFNPISAIVTVLGIIGLAAIIAPALFIPVAIAAALIATASLIHILTLASPVDYYNYKDIASDRALDNYRKANALRASGRGVLGAPAISQYGNRSLTQRIRDYSVGIFNLVRGVFTSPVPIVTFTRDEVVDTAPSVVSPAQEVVKKQTPVVKKAPTIAKTLSTIAKVVGVFAGIAAIVAIAAPALALSLPVIFTTAAIALTVQALVSPAASTPAKQLYKRVVVAPAVVVGNEAVEEVVTLVPVYTVQDLVGVDSNQIVEIANVVQSSVVSNRIAIIAALMLAAALAFPILALPGVFIAGIAAIASLYSLAPVVARRAVNKLVTPLAKIAGKVAGKVGLVAQVQKPVQMHPLVAPVRTVFQIAAGIVAAPIVAIVNFINPPATIATTPTLFYAIASSPFTTIALALAAVIAAAVIAPVFLAPIAVIAGIVTFAAIANFIAADTQRLVLDDTLRKFRSLPEFNTITRRATTPAIDGYRNSLTQRFRNYVLGLVRRITGRTPAPVEITTAPTQAPDSVVPVVVTPQTPATPAAPVVKTKTTLAKIIERAVKVGGIIAGIAVIAALAAPVFAIALPVTPIFAVAAVVFAVHALVRPTVPRTQIAFRPLVIEAVEKEIAGTKYTIYQLVPVAEEAISFGQFFTLAELAQPSVYANRISFVAALLLAAAIFTPIPVVLLAVATGFVVAANITSMTSPATQTKIADIAKAPVRVISKIAILFGLATKTEIFPTLTRPAFTPLRNIFEIGVGLIVSPAVAIYNFINPPVVERTATNIPSIVSYVKPTLFYKIASSPLSAIAVAVATVVGVAFVAPVFLAPVAVVAGIVGIVSILNLIASEHQSIALDQILANFRKIEDQRKRLTTLQIKEYRQAVILKIRNYSDGLFARLTEVFRPSEVNRLESVQFTPESQQTILNLFLDIATLTLGVADAIAIIEGLERPAVDTIDELAPTFELTPEVEALANILEQLPELQNLPEFAELTSAEKAIAVRALAVELALQLTVNDQVRQLLAPVIEELVSLVITQGITDIETIEAKVKEALEEKLSEFVGTFGNSSELSIRLATHFVITAIQDVLSETELADGVDTGAEEVSRAGGVAARTTKTAEAPVETATRTTSAPAASLIDLARMLLNIDINKIKAQARYESGGVVTLLFNNNLISLSEMVQIMNLGLELELAEAVKDSQNVFELLNAIEEIVKKAEDLESAEETTAVASEAATTETVAPAARETIPLAAPSDAATVSGVGLFSQLSRYAASLLVGIAYLFKLSPITAGQTTRTADVYNTIATSGTGTSLLDTILQRISTLSTDLLISPAGSLIDLINEAIAEVTADDATMSIGMIGLAVIAKLIANAVAVDDVNEAAENVAGTTPTTTAPNTLADILDELSNTTAFGPYIPGQPGSTVPAPFAGHVIEKLLMAQPGIFGNLPSDLADGRMSTSVEIGGIPTSIPEAIAPSAPTAPAADTADTAAGKTEIPGSIPGIPGLPDFNIPDFSIPDFSIPEVVKIDLSGLAASLERRERLKDVTITDRQIWTRVIAGVSIMMLGLLSPFLISAVFGGALLGGAAIASTLIVGSLFGLALVGALVMASGLQLEMIRDAQLEAIEAGQAFDTTPTLFGRIGNAINKVLSVNAQRILGTSLTAVGIGLAATAVTLGMSALFVAVIPTLLTFGTWALIFNSMQTTPALTIWNAPSVLNQFSTNELNRLLAMSQTQRDAYLNDLGVSSYSREEINRALAQKTTLAKLGYKMLQKLAKAEKVGGHVYVAELGRYVSVEELNEAIAENIPELTLENAPTVLDQFSLDELQRADILEKAAEILGRDVTQTEIDQAISHKKALAKLGAARLQELVDLAPDSPERVAGHVYVAELGRFVSVEELNEALTGVPALTVDNSPSVLEQYSIAELQDDNFIFREAYDALGRNVTREEVERAINNKLELAELGTVRLKELAELSTDRAERVGGHIYVAELGRFVSVENLTEALERASAVTITESQVMMKTIGGISIMILGLLSPFLISAVLGGTLLGATIVTAALVWGAFFGLVLLGALTIASGVQLSTQRDAQIEALETGKAVETTPTVFGRMGNALNRLLSVDSQNTIGTGLFLAGVGFAAIAATLGLPMLLTASIPVLLTLGAFVMFFNASQKVALTVSNAPTVLEQFTMEELQSKNILAEAAEALGRHVTQEEIDQAIKNKNNLAALSYKRLKDLEEAQKVSGHIYVEELGRFVSVEDLAEAIDRKSTTRTSEGIVRNEAGDIVSGTETIVRTNPETGVTESVTTKQYSSDGLTVRETTTVANANGEITSRVTTRYDADRNKISEVVNSYKNGAVTETVRTDYDVKTGQVTTVETYRDGELVSKATSVYRVEGGNKVETITVKDSTGTTVAETTKRWAGAELASETTSTYETRGGLQVEVTRTETLYRNGEIEAITETIFGTDLTTVTVKDKTGKPVSQAVLDYDEYGRVISSTSTNFDNGRITRETYGYDANDRVVRTETVVRDQEGKLVHSSITKTERLMRNGVEITRSTKVTLARDNTRVTTVSEQQVINGRLVTVTEAHRTKDGEVVLRYTYNRTTGAYVGRTETTTNADGTRVQVQTYDAAGNINRRVVTRLDSTGKVIATQTTTFETVEGTRVETITVMGRNGDIQSETIKHWNAAGTQQLSEVKSIYGSQNGLRVEISRIETTFENGVPVTIANTVFSENQTVTTITDSAGRVLRQETTRYDELARAIETEVMDFENSTISTETYSYDVLDNRASTETVTYEMTSTGRGDVISRSATTYEYEGKTQISQTEKTYVNQNGKWILSETVKTENFSRDGREMTRVTTITRQADGSLHTTAVVSTEMTVNGQRQRVVLSESIKTALGRTATTYRYSARTGALLGSTRTVRDAAGNVTRTVETTYAQIGNVTTQTRVIRDSQGKVLGETVHRIDQNGEVIEMTTRSLAEMQSKAAGISNEIDQLVSAMNRTAQRAANAKTRTERNQALAQLKKLQAKAQNLQEQFEAVHRDMQKWESDFGISSNEIAAQLNRRSDVNSNMNVINIIATRATAVALGQKAKEALARAQKAAKRAEDYAAIAEFLPASTDKREAFEKAKEARQEAVQARAEALEALQELDNLMETSRENGIVITDAIESDTITQRKQEIELGLNEAVAAAEAAFERADRTLAKQRVKDMSGRLKSITVRLAELAGLSLEAAELAREAKTPEERASALNQLQSIKAEALALQQEYQSTVFDMKLIIDSRGRLSLAAQQQLDEMTLRANQSVDNVRTDVVQGELAAQAARMREAAKRAVYARQDAAMHAKNAKEALTPKAKEAALANARKSLAEAKAAEQEFLAAQDTYEGTVLVADLGGIVYSRELSQAELAAMEMDINDAVSQTKVSVVQAEKEVVKNQARELFAKSGRLASDVEMLNAQAQALLAKASEAKGHSGRRRRNWRQRVHRAKCGHQGLPNWQWLHR